MAEHTKKFIEKRTYGDEEIDVIFRKSTPMSDKKCQYPGFEPGTATLRKGSIHRKGALPLPCDIIFDRDVAVPMRDGTTIYVDILVLVLVLVLEIEKRKTASRTRTSTRTRTNRWTGDILSRYFSYETIKFLFRSNWPLRAQRLG